MRAPLNQVAKIFTGVSLKEKPILATRTMERVLLMRLGDLDEEGNINTHPMISIIRHRSFDKFIVETDDIVWRGRGASFAATVMSRTDIPVVVSSPLIIIRPNRQRVDSSYLAWALTNNSARRYYAEYSHGSNIVGVGKNDLEHMEIDLPPLHLQQRIGQIKNLEKEEKNLLIRYKVAKTKFVEAIIANSTHQEQ